MSARAEALRVPRPRRGRWRLPRPGGGLLLLAIAAACALAPWLPLPDPEALGLESRLASPSVAHPLGTDAMGRDLLSRALHGGRLSLGVGLAAALLGTGAGALIGAAAATGGRRLDALLMRGVDLALALPALFLALILGARTGGNALGLALILAAFSWMEPGRLARTGLAPLRDGDLLAAARAAGVPWPRMLHRYLLPQIGGQLRAAFVLALGHAVLAEATLSFLGFGVQPPAASWGNLIAGSRPYVADAPWMLLAPAAFLFAALWSANGYARRPRR